MLFPLATLGTLLLEGWGGSWRSFGDTPVSDLLMSQYVTAHRVTPMDGYLFGGVHFMLTNMCLFDYAYCFASKNFSMQIKAVY